MQNVVNSVQVKKSVSKVNAFQGGFSIIDFVVWISLAGIFLG